jgi:hypothetical protein
MTFLALIVGKAGIGFLTLQFIVVLTHVLCKMNKDVLDTMGGFGIKELNRVVGRGQMTIHAVGDKALGVVGVGGCFPGIVGELDFMTGGTKLRGGGPYHCIIGDAENGKGDNNTRSDKNGSNDILFHGFSFFAPILILLVLTQR